MSLHNDCALCGGGEDSQNHLFLHCKIAYKIWCNLTPKTGWSWVLPGSMRALADTWHTQHFSQSGNYIWNLIPAAIVHTIWKERNCRRFEPTHLFKTDNDLILEVKTLVLTWAEAAASGSSGETLKQILEFLNYKNLQDLNRDSTCVIHELIQTKTGVKGQGPKLSFVSGIWSTGLYPLKPVFKDTVSASYKAEVESVDFQQSEAARWKVNKWVERKGLIQDILPEGSFDCSTVIVAANALYFKGSWQPNQFNPDLTEDKPFYLLNGSKIQVPFMMTEEEYPCVSCYKDFNVLKLSYKTLEVASRKKDAQRFSMCIVLPNERDGLGEVIEKVSSDSAGFLNSYLPTNDVAVRYLILPKFKILFDFQAKRVLKELGLELPFDERKPELTEMLVGNEESICVSEVLHKCFVEVEEQGTEAAASTVEVEYYLCDDDCGFYSPPGVTFVADHPFMFMIREENSGVLLFMGHVLNPLL
ncbi:serpin-ZX-like [Papaver somniferum]|uniref:serpin-ZX-like n=1 Tax=Papaver somniferum TaxID=3469 RepID=UPI000E6FB493|nr:serpin-ZX-like [Papaver somniferum]